MNIVQVGGADLNMAVTSREEILAVCREIVAEEGLSSVNMRLVASRCNIALGSVYNYFPSKSELLLATIESVWMDIFHMNGQVLVFESFTACIAWLFDTVYKSSQKYPEFFNLHSMSFAAKDKNEGRKMMEISLMHLKKNLVQILTEDQNVRENVFENELTPEIFVEYVFTLLMSILLEKQKSCEPLLTMIAHSIYESHF